MSRSAIIRSARPTAGREVCDAWPDHVYQWHREGFDLPRGATLLAEGDTFPVQAFRQGDAAYAIQFHPEVTHAMMCRWTIRGQHRMELPGAKQRVAHFEDRLLHDTAARAWLNSFLDCWLASRRSAKSRRKKIGITPTQLLFRRSERIDAIELGKNLPSDDDHQKRADAADQHRRDRADQGRDRAGAEFAELVRRLNEQRIDRADPAACLIRRLSCTSVLRMTTLTMSAAPSTVSAAIDSCERLRKREHHRCHAEDCRPRRT